ncbi:PucR family transcriptional regulator [Nocardioides lentus]|uniref:PucR family transcriptional regulator n=1 Tax=Nocardioides lentus TaxID=338077 RepID=UPI0031DFD1E5
MTEQLVERGWRAETRDFLRWHRETRAAALADDLVATIERDHLAYRRAGVVSHASLRQSCRTNVAAVLDLMVASVEHGAPDPGEPAYDPARATGAVRAREGLPLDHVLRSFRIGGRLIWDDLVRSGADRLSGSGLREVGSLLWEVVDETSAQMAAAYHGHERSRVRTDEQRRAALWEDLVGGRARDPGFALEASGLLDLPPFAEVLVVLADGVEPRTFESALAPHATAATWRGDLLLGVVALREDRPEAAYDALRALAGVDRPGGGRTGGGRTGGGRTGGGRTGGGRARVVSSGVVDGLGEVGLGYQQARAALRSAPAAPAFVPYDAALPEVLLLSVPDVAERLVDRWITPLRDLGDEGTVLLETLAAWVTAGGSASRAAPLVPCHRNTVLNRLRRVTQVTGLALDDDAPPLDLDLALRAAVLARRHD